MRDQRGPLDATAALLAGLLDLRGGADLMPRRLLPLPPRDVGKRTVTA